MGKRRPFIFIGAIVAGLSYIAMWQLSAENSQLYNFWYFLGWSVVFFIGMTIFSVPYVAMGLRDEQRLPRANATHGCRTVDWPVGVGHCTLVLDHPLRSQLVRIRNRGGSHTIDLRRSSVYGHGNGTCYFLSFGRDNEQR